MSTATTPARQPAVPGFAVPVLPPPMVVEEADIEPLGHLLPPTAAALIRCAGVKPALALLQRWPGVTVPCPKHADSNPAGARRWAQIAEVVGDEAMPAIAAHYGGSILDVPVCRVLLMEKRNRWLRARYDELTSARLAALSGSAAIYELNLALAEAGQPMTYRSIEQLLYAGNRDADPAQQLPLFDDGTAAAPAQP